MSVQDPSPLLEICVDTPSGLRTAIEAGADRIELCSSLTLGGLTPSPGLIALAGTSPIPVYAMIRPRAGNFVFDDDENGAMLADIAAVRAAGLAGVVLGASRPDRTLDEAVLSGLAGAAAGLGRTLHRAFDLVPDRSDALQTAIALGFERILTSGGARDAEMGLSALARLVDEADRRISIMPGGGVRSENVAEIIRRTGVREIHASGRSRLASQSDLVALGFEPPEMFATDGRKVAALRAEIRFGL